jgi:hypothetical protein
MFKLVSLSFAVGVAILAAPAVAAAAKAQRDKCAPRPGDFRRQCLIELGGYCDPETGSVILRGPGAGTVLGVARWESCIERKRAEKHR